MSYFSKITQVFRRIKNMKIDSCFFGEKKFFSKKRNSIATIPKPYEPKVNSVFQTEIPDKKALETTQEIVDTLGKEYGRTSSMAERNARRTTEEACDYALRKLDIKPVSMNVGSSSRFSSQLICSKPPKEWLIHIKDLIKPEELKNLKEWDDYVLLIHNSSRTPLIKKDGLRCLTDINPELASQKRSIGFSNDPDLIYFRPKTPHSKYEIGDNSVVIAVPKKNVRVFNQEERVTQNFPYYCGRSMPVEEYDKLISQIKPGECLRGDKRIVPDEKVGCDCYIPEVCFDDKYIPPDYFVRL